MRLRDLFRSQPNHERKLTSSITPLLDANTFLNAASENDIGTLQKYLLAGFSPDQADSATKVTALHIAVETANLRIIQLLLQAGAQINICDVTLSTPLHIAAYMGYDEIVQILLTHGADMFYQDDTGRNAFHLAVSTGRNRLVQHFLFGIDDEHSIIHITDAQSWTPLMCACANNHPTMVALLLSYGADITVVNDRGMNVFHIAAFLGSSPLLHELLDGSFDDEILLRALNQGDNRNQTPLFQACLEGHLDVALTLLHAGANAYHLDNENQTCLHAMLSSSVIFKRHIRLFYRLIEFVDFRSDQDNLSRTLLDLAYLNQVHSVIYLLTVLNYKRNYAILSHTEYDENPATSMFSLRQLCSLAFKRSIIYYRNRKQLSQHELLESALQQTFHVDAHTELHASETSQRKSFDDLSTSHKKTSKVTKKTSKASATYASLQSDLSQQSQSSWSLFGKKPKQQRPLTISSETVHLHPVPTLTSDDHPMKNLALAMLTAPTKLDDLLDVPSLSHNQHLLDEDMKSAMSTYKLENNDSSNEI